MGILLITFVLFMTHEIGYSSGFHDSSMQAMRLNDEPIKTPNYSSSMRWITLGFPIVSIYLLILAYFPAILDEGSDDKDTTTGRADSVGEQKKQNKAEMATPDQPSD